MSTGSQSIARAKNPFAPPLGTSVIGSVLLAVLFLRVLGVPLSALALLFAAPALLWWACRHPITALGLALVFMPISPLAIILGRFFGPSFMMSDAFKVCDRVLLLIPTCILWWRNGIKLKAPDWILLACFGLALVRLAFGGALVPLLSDFDLMIAYAAGRVAILTASQQESWATRAVWLVAILSVLGMIEVFFIGEGPRTLLYLTSAEGATEGKALNAAFHASGFGGLRESSTMFGPLQFAPLCMVALVVWWVYRRSLLPAAIIAAGLICSVTRSAWVGTALAIAVLAVVMHQKKRLLLSAALALTLFAVSIPIVGLADYLLLARTGQDLSAQGHGQSVLAGITYMFDHPFGVGPGNAGAFQFRSDSNAVWIENTYLTLAAEYGMPTALSFIGFIVSALWVVWRQRTQLGYAAVGILVGFAGVIVFAPLHDVFSLASWIWFPVGLAVRSSEAPGT